jgi:hypothetical protein
MSHQLRDLHDDGSVAGHAKGFECVSARGRYGPMHVDAVGHNVNAFGRNSACLENRGHSSRDSDDRGGATIFPSRANVGAQRKVDTARDDHRNSGAECRESGYRNGVCGVRVYDVDCAFSNSLSQPQRRSWIELRHRAAVDDIEARGHRPLGQWLTTPRRDRRRVTAPRELTREPERLTLTASPASLGVDVKYAECHGAQLPFAAVRTQASQAWRSK